MVGIESIIRIDANDLRAAWAQMKRELSQFMKGGFTQGVRSGIFGGAGGSPAGKEVGGLALMGGAVSAISMGMREIVKFLGDASPALKGQFMILQKAFMLFFKPFGDFLASALRPLSMLLMKSAIKFLEISRTPGGGALTGALTGAAAGAVVGGPAGALIGGVAGGVAGFLTNPEIQGAIKGFGFGLGQATQKILADVGAFGKELWDGLTGSVGSAMETLKGFGTWIWDSITGLFRAEIDTILGFGTWLWNTVTDLFKNQINVLLTFGKWVWDTVTGLFKRQIDVLLSFGKWLWDTLTGLLKKGIDTLLGFGKWVWDTFTGVLKTAFNFLSNVGQNIFDLIIGAIKGGLNVLGNLGQMVINAVMGAVGGIGKFFFGGQAGIDFVPRTGPYLLHRGERVINEMDAKREARTVVFRPQVSVNVGRMSSDIDLDAAARRAGRMVEIEMRKRGII